MTALPAAPDPATARRPGAVGPRYEVLPFAKAEAQAAEVGEPLRLTVTTSPKHGVDRSLDVATRLRALGHDVTLHVAARMVRDEPHLDRIVTHAHAAGIDDFFVVGGDAPDPLGPYTEAARLLDALVAHPRRPPRLGIAGYPEGHPLIDPDVLADALDEKARVADYVATQLCFSKDAVLRWVESARARGILLPVFVGAVGPIERRRLLEISMRIGVGPSLRFVRKQHGLTRLFRSPFSSASRFYDDVAPLVGDPRYGIAGFHLFTFNELTATRAWYEERRRR